MWAAVFSIRCYGNLQSWSSAQGRHQRFTKSRQNYSPEGVKSSEEMRTQSSRTEEFTLISAKAPIEPNDKEISVGFDCNEFFRDERGSDIQIIYCRSDAARGYESLLKRSCA